MKLFKSTSRYFGSGRSERKQKHAPSRLEHEDLRDNPTLAANTQHCPATKSDVSISTDTPDTHQPSQSNSTKNPGNSQYLRPTDNDVLIGKLWGIAYEKLREEDRHLVAAYESKLQSAGFGATFGSETSIQNDMELILRQRMDQVNQDAWKLRFGSSEVQVKDLVEPTIGVVRRANEYINGALSTNPYASLAWAGVSLLLSVSWHPAPPDTHNEYQTWQMANRGGTLQLLLNPSKQGASLAKGLDYISSLIAQSQVREHLYQRRHESDTADRDSSFVPCVAYKSALEALYRQILRFQATAYCYFEKNTAFRLGLDTIAWNDWDTLLDQIREKEREFLAVSELLRDTKYDEECSAARARHQESSSTAGMELALMSWGCERQSIKPIRRENALTYSDGSARSTLLECIMLPVGNMGRARTNG